LTELTAWTTVRVVPSLEHLVGGAPRSRYGRNRLRLFRALLSGGEPDGATPTAAYIESTSRCNLECPMCARQLAGAGWHDRDMSMDEFERALAALGDACEHVLPFAGGEPLLHADIARMVARCGSTGRSTELATNATLLTSRASRDLILAGLDTLIISLDAAGRETYERIRCGADYERTCDNVHSFLRAKRKLRGRTWVIVQMIDLPENRGEAPEFERQWGGVAGVDSVRVKPDEIRVRAPKAAGGTETPRDHPCHFPWIGPLLVRYDGAVYPCCHAWRGEPVGNVGHQSVPEIWNGPAMSALRAAHREGRASESYPACRDCQAVVPHRILVAGSLLVPPHVTRRAIPYVEALDRQLGHRLIRS
jgi:radical SAM protein with 4Fe4S-binding SPASM domain